MDVAVHQLHATEADGFVLHELAWEIDRQLPLTVAGVRITGGDTIGVERLSDLRSGWPPRDRTRLVFRLHPDTWGRAVRNIRHSGYTGWSYSKIAVNVGWFTRPPTQDVFTSEPAHYFDEQARLR